MALRDGMGTLVGRLRQMVQAGTTDYTLTGTAYWTDAQLQDRLDQHVLVLDHALMVSKSEWNNGSLEYRDYYTPRGIGNLETTDSGTQYFSIEDTSGNDATMGDFEITDYAGGWFRRAADTKGTQYQIKARSYNLHAAAAGILAIVQPGGSKRDPEVIEACDAHGIAMMFTGRRTFRH